MLENNGSIQPVGNSMYITDMDYSWKKKDLVLNVTPRGNSYNLVQLKPSSGKKRFCIKEEVSKSKESATSTECKTNDASKLPHHTTDEVSETSCPTTSETRLKHVQLLPGVLPHAQGMEVSNPEYINVRKQELQSVKESGHKSDSESDEYENEGLLEQLKENTTKSKYPVYINL